jgi:hypothetical protein
MALVDKHRYPDWCTRFTEQGLLLGLSGDHRQCRQRASWPKRVHCFFRDELGAKWVGTREFLWDRIEFGRSGMSVSTERTTTWQLRSRTS